jgi:hypothetical protein
MLEFRTREQCEQFQMAAFGIATCERSDQECPWGRQDEPTIIASRPPDVSSEQTAFLRAE